MAPSIFSVTPSPAWRKRLRRRRRDRKRRHGFRIPDEESVTCVWRPTYPPSLARLAHPPAARSLPLSRPLKRCVAGRGPAPSVPLGLSGPPEREKPPLATPARPD
ncbi:hypothetical protein chiPu_0020742 [Chiloscyllium punctatum]|uniref:Uncharacterized protein n=1 Tax=Chiloscyllium punctatum TaxID=137246 RepID=A0A401RJ73_CHIPU|nr:hypothetical protein [Chiloscyllium punctatum]